MSKLIHTWKQISLIEEDIRLPNGHHISHTTISHPGAAVILPINEKNEIILINQFRPSLRKWLLELPAGTIEAGEKPIECAQRELEEETGYSASNWYPLGQVTPLAGFCDEIQHLFVAKGLSKTQRYHCDEDEIIEVIAKPIEEIQRLIVNDTITDAKTIACLSKAMLCGHI
ncbi:NUDIX hydrolase [Vibrio amylolyticus]|uniref:NUDIX hydrolase n=1 Tax=Vibrio TaxID=662 RepID=UPI000C825FB2|nr:NUDIX hydrolase [Vibrio sp. 10N.261.55.A7]PMJ89682.1 ADP-ribose pyrophosphatase [Vibrio sp. 10N.261.55.A7]